MKLGSAPKGLYQIAVCGNLELSRSDLNSKVVKAHERTFMRALSNESSSHKCAPKGLYSLELSRSDLK